MEATDFTSSALIGHLVVVNLIAKLVSRGVLSGAEVREIMDDALLLLETTQAGFPENEAAFVEARKFLEEFRGILRISQLSVMAPIPSPTLSGLIVLSMAAAPGVTRLTV